MLRQRSEWLALATLMAFVLAGCGPTQFPTAKVLGKVVFEDAPVSGGSVTFIPVNADGSPRDGKAAVGNIGDGGTFTLTTYEDGDGAIIGQHQVVYSAPEEGSDENVEVEVDADGAELAAEPPASESDTGPELDVAENSRIVEVKDIETNAIKIALAPISADEDDDE